MKYALSVPNDDKPVQNRLPVNCPAPASRQQTTPTHHDILLPNNSLRNPQHSPIRLTRFTHYAS